MRGWYCKAGPFQSSPLKTWEKARRVRKVIPKSHIPEVDRNEHMGIMHFRQRRWVKEKQGDIIVTGNYNILKVFVKQS